MKKGLKTAFGGTFAVALYGVGMALTVGGIHWLWMAAKIGSVWMFVIGMIFPPAYIVTAPVGLYAFFRPYPEWVYSVFGENHWTPAAKAADVADCQSLMEGRGIPKEKSSPFCHCMDDSSQAAFGNRDYEQMATAQPNPNGTEYDQRLFAVVTSCKKLLPE